MRIPQRATDMPDEPPLNWYTQTATPAPVHPRLLTHETAGLVVIGGGATGLSAALHAAEAGQSVILLEAHKIGHGASGRNGGQIIPGLRKGAAELIATYGPERARALFDLALEARSLVLARIDAHAIACDLSLTGHLHAAIKPTQIRDFEAELRALETTMAYPHTRLLDAAETRQAVATPYHAALLDAGGGHFHTLNYTIGLARAAAAAGVRIFEQSAATRLATSPRGATVTTTAGSVHAARVILAGDALLAGIAPQIEARQMPIANYIVTTAPLENAAALIPGNAAVSDARFVVNYFRRTPDNRLMFGGGERYTRTPPRDIKAFVRPFLERTFPQLKDVELTHGWGGLVGVSRTRLPDIGNTGPVLWAHGYSGQGAILSTLAGALLAEASIGRHSRYDQFNGLSPKAFPGGPALRGPLHILGMLWYALRDRL